MVVAVFATRPSFTPSIASGGMGRCCSVVLALPVLASRFVAWAVGQPAPPAGRRRGARRWRPPSCSRCGAFTLVRTGGISGDVDIDLALAVDADPRGAAPGRRRPTSRSRCPRRCRRRRPSDGAGAGRRARQPSPARGARAARRAAAPAPRLPASRTRRRRLARLPRARPRRRRARRADRDRLVGVAAGRAVAPADRTGLVVLRGPRRSSSTPRSSAARTRSSPAYSLTTGQPVWRHRDAARFWESNGGAGPRGTPTLSQRPRLHAGRDRHPERARRRARAPSCGRATRPPTPARRSPAWGFAGSPLVVGDLVDRGRLRPARRLRRRHRRAALARPEAGGASYSSPHLVTIDGVAAGPAAERTGARPASRPPTARSLWEHRVEPGVRIVQPALTADGDVLIAVGDAMGGAACAASRSRTDPPDGRPRSAGRRSGLKPYFNDFVVHEGHAFGFDGSILAVHRPRGRRAQVEGRPLRQRPARPAARPGPAAGAVGGGRAGAGQGGPRPVHGGRASSRRSRARPGTTRCWSATSCWSATARRWPRSGCPARPRTDWPSRAGDDAGTRSAATPTKTSW